MNKKFLSAILFGALMITSTGTFVSCKDYDDDINDVQGQVDTNKSALSTLTTQLTSLQTALSSAQSTADAAKAAADAAQTTGNAALAAAEEAKAAAAQAKAEAIEEAIAEVNALKAWVEAQDHVTADELAAALAPVAAKIEGIESGMSEIWTYINETLTSADQTALMNIIALQEDLDIQKEALAKLEEALQNSTANEALAAQIAEVKASVEELATELDSKIGQTSLTLSTFMQDYEAAMAELIEYNNVQDANINMLTNVIATLTEEDDEINAEITELWNTISGKGGFTEQINSLYNSLTTKIDAEIATLHVLVETRLASLTFIPNAYVDGVEAIVFRSYSYNALTLTADKKDSKDENYTAANKATIVNPVVYAQYQVSPSTVGLDQFVDEEGNLKDNLEFYIVKNAEFINSGRAAASDDFNVTPEFVSLENGVLTVKVNITGVPATAEEISVVALQVKTDDGAVITSDYATVFKKDYKDLRIVDEQKSHLETNPVDYHFRRYINSVDTDAGINDVVVWGDNTDNSIDLEFDYRSSLNLNEVVGVHELTDTHTDTELTPLGMHMEYDVVLNYIIGANQTDQKDFVTLKDGILTARVFDEAGAAAIGRTPIIRARLMHGDNIVKIAYIKVKIVKETTAPQNKVYSLVVDDFKFVCKESGVVKTTIAQINTQLYNEIGLSKDEFHARYTYFEDVNWANEDGIVTDLGTVTELNETVDGTTTHLLQWTITENEMWAHAGEAVTNRIYYRVVAGSNVFVEVELKSNIKDIQKLYDMKKADFIANYWDANKTYTKFNVAVPASTSDNSPNNCTFINNLNAPFTTWAANSTEGVPGIMKLDASITALNYYFCEDVEEIEEIGDVKVTFVVSENGLTLGAYEAGTTAVVPHTIATIKNDDTGATPNTIEYNKNDEFAKRLLNTGKMYTLIGVYGEVCDDETKKVEITFEGEDHFVANFLRPVNIAEQAADNFIDGVDVGEKGSFIRLEDLIAPYDWRNRSFEEHPNYWGFYGPFDVEVEVEDAECNLNGVRQAVPVTVELDQAAAGTMGTGVDALTSDYGFLTYKNNGTNVSAFEIYVKVKVNYGWGTILTDWITVKVDSTVNQ